MEEEKQQPKHTNTLIRINCIRATAICYTSAVSSDPTPHMPDSLRQKPCLFCSWILVFQREDAAKKYRGIVCVSFLAIQRERVGEIERERERKSESEPEAVLTEIGLSSNSNQYRGAIRTCGWLHLAPSFSAPLCSSMSSSCSSLGVRSRSNWASDSDSTAGCSNHWHSRVSSV